MSTTIDLPCPPILQYPSKPGRFAEAMLLQRMNACEKVQDRILYITYPEDGEVRGERWWATNDGHLDKTIITWDVRCDTEERAADSCRWDWEGFVAPVLNHDGFYRPGCKGVLKVP